MTRFRILGRLVISVLLAAVASGSALAQEATPTPSPSESPSPEATATPEPEPEPVSTPDAERDLGAELDALRSEVERLREAIEPETLDDAPRRAGLRTADLSARAPGALRLGGVGTAAGVVAGKRDSQFVLPRAAVFGFAPVGDRVSFGGEVTMLGGGAELVDADRGMPGRGDVFLQHASVDIVVVPELLSLRGGLLSVPLGRSNLVSDEAAQELLSRPAEALWVIPTPWSDIGAGITGGTYLGGARLEWQGYVLSGPSAGIDARTGTRDARQPPGADLNADKALAGRITLEPASGVELGVSGYSGAYSAGGGMRLSAGAAELAVERGPILFEGQGVYARTNGGFGTLGLPIPVTLFGGSTQLTWRFLPEALGAVLPPAFQASSIGASVRYSFADTDAEDPDDNPTLDDPNAFTRRDRLTLGLSFRPVPRCVLRAEYELRTEGGSNELDDDQAVFSASASF